MASMLTARLTSTRTQLLPILVGTVAAAGCIFLTLFDPRTESFYPVCPFRALTGRACAGCGVTRGLHELFTGHPVAALRLNLLLAVLVPGAVYGFVAWTLRQWNGPRLPTLTLTQRNILIGIGVLVAFTLVRNLPWEPFPTFSSLQ
jgi:hypothetical protein